MNRRPINEAELRALYYLRGRLKEPVAVAEHLRISVQTLLAALAGQPLPDAVLCRI